jgi:hypothetical protein
MVEISSKFKEVRERLMSRILEMYENDTFKEVNNGFGCYLCRNPDEWKILIEEKTSLGKKQYSICFECCLDAFPDNYFNRSNQNI